MTTFPTFPGFDGLMTLSRREGVDIRPTLLRVLTDLYVQTPSHTVDEERQYVELTSRLIDEVDDATRSAVRARLSVYPKTPLVIASKLGLHPFSPRSVPAPRKIFPENLPRTELQVPDNSRSTTATLVQSDASELSSLFFSADSRERRLILRKLESAPISASASVDTHRAKRAVVALEHMALEADLIGFTAELADTLTLPPRIAQQIVNDIGGETLACAAKALPMPPDIFERVLLFLDPELGASVTRVYTLSRLYDMLSERAALTMLAAWRGAMPVTTRTQHHPVLHDNERQRARPVPVQTRPSIPTATGSRPGATTRNMSNGWNRFRSD